MAQLGTNSEEAKKDTRKTAGLISHYFDRKIPPHSGLILHGVCYDQKPEKKACLLGLL